MKTHAVWEEEECTECGTPLKKHSKTGLCFVCETEELQIGVKIQNPNIERNKP